MVNSKHKCKFIDIRQHNNIILGTFYLIACNGSHSSVIDVVLKLQEHNSQIALITI